MKRLVLVGGGHAHLFVLEAFANAPLADVELVLVSPVRLAPYSGMMPGVIAGKYRYADACADLAPLARAAGARWIEARVASLDAHARTLHCSDGSTLEFDLASLDIGSTPPRHTLPGAEANTLAVKPIETFLAGIEAFAERARNASTPLRACVVGAGAAGAEIAAALRHRFGTHAHVRLLGAATRVAPELNASASARVTALLAERGVEFAGGTEVTNFAPGRLATRTHGEFEFDLCVLAIGASPAAWLADTGLALDARGFVRVDATLRSVSHPAVFAAGDVAAIDGAPRPKSGVYAVRAGPPLAHNLRAQLLGEPLRAWSPQARALALLSVGPGYAVGAWGPLSFDGAWVWRWKDRIDRRFIARFARA